MEKTNNHIEEYFLKNDNDSKAIASKELFKDDKIVLKTDLTDDEITIINKLYYNDAFLAKNKLNTPFDLVIQNYMKLKVSKDRQSRKEFVSINKNNDNDDTIEKFGNLSNIMQSRKWYIFTKVQKVEERL